MSEVKYPGNDHPFPEVDGFAVWTTIKIDRRFFFILFFIGNPPPAQVVPANPFKCKLHCPFPDELTHKIFFGTMVTGIYTWHICPLPYFVYCFYCSKIAREAALGRSVTM